MHSQIVVNPRFHGGPVMAVKIGPGDRFWRGTDFSLHAGVSPK